MNLFNLKRMFNHILLNVPKEKINMLQFRDSIDLKSHECQTAGCIIGHCIILDEWKNIPKLKDGSINFLRWSYYFTGLFPYSDTWKFCFGMNLPNDKEFILSRLKNFIDNNGRISYFHDIIPLNKLTPYEL